MKPRGYQQQVIDGAGELWRTNRRIAAVLATGAGKTVIFSHIAKQAHAAGRPTLVIAHRTELIDQAIDKLRQVNPTAKVGMFKGPVKQWRADIVVGSVQTASRPAALELLKAAGFGLVVVDETHHVAADTYQRVLRELGCFDPAGPLTLGVTATLDRSDRLSLGDTFEAVVEPQVGLLDLIRSDPPYLVRPRGIRVRIPGLDLARARKTAGDLNAHDVGAAMTAVMAPQRMVEAWVEHAKGRPTVAFLPTVDVSVDTAQAFRDAGFVAAHLDAATPDHVRKETLDRFRAGEVDVLCNVGLFTEGTDLPMISCIMMGRMTMSGSLYQQMVGRGLRMHPGKTDCLVLDFCGVAGRHGLATLVSLNGAPRPDDVPDDLLIYEQDDVVDPAGDESDAEPTEREPYADGDTVHELFDLFGESHSNWLRTPGGTWFIPAGQGFVYLAGRGGDRYDVSWLVGDGSAHGVERFDLQLEYAMAAGDEYVAARPIWQAERDAPWRKLRVRGGRTKGEVADDRAIARAAALLDRRAS